MQFRYISLFVDFSDNSSTEYVTTKDGFLQITLAAKKSSWKEYDFDTKKLETRTKNYTSAMVQTWNKFCFTGGVFEISVQLPGKMVEGGESNAAHNYNLAEVLRHAGLWPAAWLMGNLARATFEKTTTVRILNQRK